MKCEKQNILEIRFKVKKTKFKVWFLGSFMKNWSLDQNCWVVYGVIQKFPLILLTVFPSSFLLKIDEPTNSIYKKSEIWPAGIQKIPNVP